MESVDAVAGSGLWEPGLPFPLDFPFALPLGLPRAFPFAFPFPFAGVGVAALGFVGGICDVCDARASVGAEVSAEASGVEGRLGLLDVCPFAFEGVWGGSSRG